MTKTPDNGQQQELSADMKPRVAYTLNNYQPVRSTIIGEQPLFYMDYDGDIEDDFDDHFDLETIERGLTTLEQKLGILNADPQEAEQNKEALFAAAKTPMTKDRGQTAKQGVSVAAIREKLSQSRLAQSFLDFAAAQGVTIAAGRQTQTAFYDGDAETIYINGALGADDMALLCVRELRRLWQDKKGAALSPLSFHPDQAILINRAQIADVNAVMVRVAWEMRLAGDKGPWRRIEQSSFYDLGRAFAREAHNNFRTLDNGTACAAVFEAWFLSERCQHQDRKLIQNMLSDYRGYNFGDPQMSLQIATKLVLALGAMPYGKNYLAPYVSTIVADALFTEIRDRANANFLWFIKFERSFAEAERDLQEAEDINSRCSMGGALRNQDTQDGTDNEKDTNIIPLLCDPDRQNHMAGTGHQSRRGGTVIPFSRY